MNFKRILKITGGIIVFFTLPTLLFFGFVYFKYSEDLPVGVQNEVADQMAQHMLEALDYKAYQSTDYIEWTFSNRRHYKWEKSKSTCTIFWKNNKVILDQNNSQNSKAFVGDEQASGPGADALIKKAFDYFNNDSFWLVAPYKVFDSGTERRLVNLEKDKQGLLVTYNSGGSTPGDSYLWHLDENFRPTSFQMWTSIIPIQGLEASWNDWTTTETGAQLPVFHKFLFIGLDITNIKTESVTDPI